MNVLAIIPARGGSKRIPNKNICLLAGRPLITYTVVAALESKHIDRLIVSTDSTEIAEIARKYGAQIPFLRPAYLAKDDVPDQPVLKHALDALREQDGYEPDIVLHLRPTTPLRTPQTIDKVIEKIVLTNAEIVRTMSRVEGVHHPYWMYRLNQDGHAIPFMEDIRVCEYYRRQLLPELYRINSAADAMKASLILRGNMLDNNNKMRIIVTPDEESLDIDTEFDFKLCEFLLGLKHAPNPNTSR